MTELGRGIDPLELNLLGSPPVHLRVQGLAQRKHPLLHTGHGTLEQEEIILDLAVVNKATERGDLLLGDILFGGGVALVGALADAEDLVIARGSVVVAVLTGTGDRPLHVVGMPGTDTRDLAQTLVRLTRQLGRAPTARHTLRSMTLGHGDDIDHLILLEDCVDIDRLLEQVAREIHLLRDRSSVHLDLHQVRLLLLDGRLADLRVRQHPHHRTVLLDPFEFARDRRSAVLRVLPGVVRKGLLLALVPILVESSLDLVAQVFGPHRRERA